ncbi:uncharacterized protein DEA37_0012886 [Paragonimus westermani]|uniref:UBX domain-containing protein 4 n=1 Tax=Paragonimus westermani TaxID=34504 RepID=A0A5J4NFB2_9TREM|nr:uncharacterized protein DEA37_0012886 [Paragonimus westermani]
MEWFGGDVVSAVRTVKEQSKLLLVFIKGSDESSLLVDQLLDEDVMRICHGIVCLRLDANSEAAAQFSAVYALLTVPCIYLIAPSGKVVDVKLGSMEKSELILWISNHVNRSSVAEPQPFVLSNDSQPSTSCQLPNSTENYPARDICPSSTNPSADVASAKVVHSNDPSGLEDRVSRAYQLIEERRRKQLEEEKMNAVSHELKRRESGKALREFKERQQAREIEEAFAERRRDEQETRLYRERLKQQIEEDRRVKRERLQALPSQTVVPIASTAIVSSSVVTCNQIRLQLRLMDGGHVVGRFEPSATLTCELRNWIQSLARNSPDGAMELPAVDETLRVKLAALVSGGYRFRQLHPSKLFSPEDETRTMADLDLSPSAVLILVPSTTGTQSAMQPVNQLQHLGNRCESIETKAVSVSYLTDRVRMSEVDVRTRPCMNARLVGVPTNCWQDKEGAAIHVASVDTQHHSSGYTREWSEFIESQDSYEGMVSRTFFLLNSGLQSFYSYVGWIFNGIYSVGSGLVSSLIPSQTGGRPAQPLAPDSPRSSSTSNSSTTHVNRAVRRQGNMARLSHLPDNSDDEQARWNGNSTEQL